MTGLLQEAPGASVVAVVSAVPAAQVQTDDRIKAENEAKAQSLATAPLSNSLLEYVERCKREAIRAKEDAGVTAQLQEAQRRRRGEHSAEKLAQLKKYKLPIYWVPLTATKCIHTEAWFRDLLMPYADKTWALDPSEIPEVQSDERDMIQYSVINEALKLFAGGTDVSDEQVHEMMDAAYDEYSDAIMRNAKTKAKAMEKLILDQQEECDFRQVFREFQSNLTTYGTAFLKGPFTTVKKMPKWEGTQRVVADSVIPACSAPSPHDMFPAPWAKDENDGYIVERIQTYRSGLTAVRKLPYYQTKQIEELLSSTQPSPQQQTGDSERAEAENRPTYPVDGRIECWQFTGPVAGYMLKTWGMSDVDEAADYAVEVLWSQNYILKVVPRWDEVGLSGYFKAVFKAVPGSYWGIGVPMLMAASQDRANMLMISMLDNTNWASGPIGWVDINRCVHPDDAKIFQPRKLIPTQSAVGQSGPPMGFMSIDLKVGELNAQYQSCLSDADNESGVPAYMYGSGASGPAAGTFSGLTTLMNAAARGIKDGLLEIDHMMMRFIQHWADWNNEYSKDENVKGDIRVLCSGATGLFIQEMQLQRLDDLFNQAVALVPILGPACAISLFKQKAKMLKADISSLPSDDDIRAMRPPPQGAAPSQGDSSGVNTPGTPASSMTQPGARPEAPASIAPVQ